MAWRQAIAIASATTFSIPVPLTSEIKMTYVKPNVTSDTAKNRTACRTGCSSLATNVQWRFHQKLFVTETTKATTDETR